jgi:hypothetical protein
VDRIMKIFCLSAALLLFVATIAAGADQSSVIANLQPDLQQALLHDAACAEPSADFTQGQLMQVPVKTEEIRVAGREAGIIATPQDACHCQDENCATYVYLKFGDGYKLTLESKFVSLHPMKIAKHGLPSLSGKLQVSDSSEETTVYDWDGHAYEPSLCATVTQRKNQRLPAIARHACSSAATVTASR